MLATLLACLSAAAPPAAEVDVSIDLGGSTAPFSHNWKRSFGSGHFLLGTRADWQRQLLKARDDLGLRGVRMHGILDDDMSVAPSARGPFHFYNVDAVLDFLVGAGVKPIIELSFMPASLARCSPATCRYAFHDSGAYKGLIMPPADPNEWYELIKALAAHMLERYGLGEVSSWHFEVWNEMWGVPYGPGSGQYLPLYNASARALKAVHPALRVGGPSSAGLEHVADLVRDARRMGVPLDFVSTHHYPSDPSCADASAGGKYALDPDCFAKEVLESAKIATDARLPFLLTEYKDGLQGGPGIGHGGPHGDAAYAAAFIIRTVPQLSSLHALSWWTFSDIFEETWMDGAPFYGGYGLLNTQGVPKPAYRAFELLGGAGHSRLLSVNLSDPTPDYPHSSTVSALATVGGGDAAAPAGLQLFLSNFGPEAGASGKPWAPRERAVRVTISAASGWEPPSRATLRRIDDNATAPHARWVAMGSPRSLTAAQLAELHAASSMPVEYVQLQNASGGGPSAVTIKLVVPPYGVVHLSAAAAGARAATV